MPKLGRRSFCLIGNGLNALSLAYHLGTQQVGKNNVLFIKRQSSVINSVFHNYNVIENGFFYSFNLRKDSVHFESLLKDLHLEENILEINKYANNISYVYENGKKYTIGKYIGHILFSLCKSYCINSSLRVNKDENLHTFLLKSFDKKICHNLIFPYCHHHFGFPPKHILMNSYFPNLKHMVKDKKSVIRHFFLSGKNDSLFSKNNKVFCFKNGNISLTDKLMEHITSKSHTNVMENWNNLIIKSQTKKIKIYSGRKRINSALVVFCLSPLELKRFLKKTKIEYNIKRTLIKYLSSFRPFKIKITNICFKKNVLPFQHSLESLLLVKENQNNKIVSVLFDSNIFPPCQKIINITKKEYNQEEPFGTSLRFLSNEQRPTKALKEIKDFMKNVLNIKDPPDLVISNDFDVFPFNESRDKRFKKILAKYLNNVKVFWPFSFFKNVEFCLAEVDKFCQSNL